MSLHRYLGSHVCLWQLLVSEADGWVAFVATPSWVPGTNWKGVHNYFPLRWWDAVWPTPQNGCSAGNATAPCVAQDGGCVCSAVEVNTSAVFTDASSVPKAVEVEAALAIGAPNPSGFAGGVYSLCATSACSVASPAVKVHLHAGSSGAFDESTIFEISVNGSAAFFANKEALVHMGGFTARNPPRFMSFRTPLERDMMYETEALLHHLMHHRNTAPFIAHRLIQRMVTSNPSPRYVKAVADAFRSGTYDGHTHSGQYGCLMATVHAMLLDREARSSTLGKYQSRSKSGPCQPKLLLRASQPLLLLTPRV